jgi:hypothetical protein
MPVSRLNMLLAAAMLAAAFALLPASATAATSGGSSAQSSGVTTGGVSPDDPEFRPTGKAKLVAGRAIPPADAPPEVVGAINAANKIVGKPYKYGGGHALVEDSGYDCSGTVSYALLAAKLIKSPLDSSSFMRWGVRGKGAWITVFTNPGHAYAVIAGLRLDTSSYGYAARRSAKRVAKSAYERGPRWRPTMRPARGFRARHPLGF